MSDCSQSQADSRIILHFSNCIQMDLINVYMFEQTVLMWLLIAFMSDFLKINAGAQVIAICGVVVLISTAC